ncbi:MAG: hypothetical protein O7D91_15505 [Planctomycetota bacterium]|nr:hypothetical protein [Planctomycetota bacterium]
MCIRASRSVVCILLITALARAQTTWYVDHANPKGCPGSGTEGDPFCLIQDGIDASVSGDQVVVADGTYFGDGNRNLDFGGRNIHLRSESLDPALCIIDCQGSEANPHRGFYFHNGETAEAEVHGFTITGGNHTFGGGMRCSSGSSPTIGDCVFGGNSATFSGGGMYNVNSSPTVTNCTFSENVAGIGGAMYNRASDLALTNSTFRSNSAIERGGAMYNFGGSNLTIHDCVFDDNSAQFGGAIFDFVSSPILTGCTFNSNTATLHGGGINNTADSNPTVSDCTFNINTAECGGGIYNTNSSGPTVSDCTFSINTAENGGGMANESGSDPTVTNCVFEGNIAGEHGGGMINSFESTPVITGCLFSENSAEQCGGGIHNTANSEDRPKVIACRFVGNTAQYGGGICNLGSRLWAIDSEFIENTAMLGSGGGMFSNSSSLFVAYCTFLGNAATDTEGAAQAGGMSGLPAGLAVTDRSRRTATVTTGWGGGTSNVSGTLVMTSSLFSLNTATRGGGGMFNSAFLSTVTNSTFSGNSATTLGGGIFIDSSSSSTVSNCIVWDNAASEGAEFYLAEFGLLTIRYSDVADGQEGVQGPGTLLWEEGNIEADPLFFDPARANYRLSANSPCIDSGDNTAVLSDGADLDGDGDTEEPIPYDLDGNPRFVDDPDTDDTGFGKAPIVDMGAYELQDPCADDDGDGRVTICHIPPGNPGNARTILVSMRALPTHLAHGDFCGPCEDGDG